MADGPICPDCYAPMEGTVCRCQIDIKAAKDFSVGPHYTHSEANMAAALEWACDTIDRLTRERDEARDWAACLQRHAEDNATLKAEVAKFREAIEEQRRTIVALCPEGMTSTEMIRKLAELDDDA